MREKLFLTRAEQTAGGTGYVHAELLALPRIYCFLGINPIQSYQQQETDGSLGFGGGFF